MPFERPVTSSDVLVVCHDAEMEPSVAADQRMTLYALIALPLLNVPVFVASVAVSLWLLVGFICALHGFRSRIMVLTTGLMVFLMASYVLSLVLLALGYEPAGLSNV